MIQEEEWKNLQAERNAWRDIAIAFFSPSTDFCINVMPGTRGFGEAFFLAEVYRWLIYLFLYVKPAKRRMTYGIIHLC